MPCITTTAELLPISHLTHGPMEKTYSELSPTTVKKLLTGSGKASKTEVAMALERYVGTQQYETDDESDAVAVGLAWLIQQN